MTELENPTKRAVVYSFHHHPPANYNSSFLSNQCSPINLRKLCVGKVRVQGSEGEERQHIHTKSLHVKLRKWSTNGAVEATVVA